MATCAIWRISDRLDKVIDYTSNIDKTKKEDISDVKYTDLHKTLEYAKAGYKTEEQYYVSGINCDPDTAYEEMIATKEFTDKFLSLTRTKLENKNYKVYFSHARFTYKNANMMVQPNELIIAIKEE